MGPSLPAPLSERLLTQPGWDPSVRRGLARMVCEIPSVEQSLPIAAFDFDETCIRGDLSETLLAHLDGETSEDLVGAYTDAVRRDVRTGYTDLVDTLVAGRTESEVRALALATLSRGITEGVLAPRETIRELIWAMHRHGWQVWVVTASPEPLVQPVAERFGVHPHRVLGMRCRKDATGRYVAGVTEPVTYRQGKLDALVAAAGASPCFAAGDSRTDDALLRSARHSLLFDRGDRDMRLEAEEAGWWIQTTESIQ
ncbi:MAG: HAD-IB family phosphatase [Myxococcales bacterium]|nr:HAD-IB family phosphatase [Myxococcales bacterium]